MVTHRQRVAAIVFLTVNAAITSTRADRQTLSRNPPPPGLRIEARDGDTIVLQDDARVKIVRQRKAHVRAIFNSTDRWLILLAGYRHSDAVAAVPARVDEVFTFTDMTGEWPLGERWEGEAVLEEYSIGIDRGGPSTGIGLMTPVGIVQLFGGQDTQQLLRDPAAAAVLSHRGFSFGGSGRPFDEAEQFQVAMAKRNTEANVQFRSGGHTMTTMRAWAGPAGGVAISMPPGAVEPLRVGGGVSPPRKIHDAAPVLPEAARQAGVRGVVILEITIGTDGSVVAARVLRSIPLLDQAALDCVRQWRFEPVQVTGGVVPVVMTATVTFN